MSRPEGFLVVSPGSPALFQRPFDHATGNPQAKRRDCRPIRQRENVRRLNRLVERIVRRSVAPSRATSDRPTAHGRPAPPTASILARSQARPSRHPLPDVVADPASNSSNGSTTRLIDILPTFLQMPPRVSCDVMPRPRIARNRVRTAGFSLRQRFLAPTVPSGSPRHDQRDTSGQSASERPNTRDTAPPRRRPLRPLPSIRPARSSRTPTGVSHPHPRPNRPSRSPSSVSGVFPFDGPGHVTPSQKSAERLA